MGEDNIYTFGLSSDEVIAHYEKADYVAWDYYQGDYRLRESVDFLVGDQMRSVGISENLERLFHELRGKDWFMTFPDFADYCKTKAQALADAQDEKKWAKKALVNIAKAGFFSSDRTIEQYNADIWNLKADKD